MKKAIDKDQCLLPQTAGNDLVILSRGRFADVVGYVDDRCAAPLAVLLVIAPEFECFDPFAPNSADGIQLARLGEQHAVSLRQPFDNGLVPLSLLGKLQIDRS